MIRALHTAASGMLARELDLSTIANNLSNMSTTGFKRRRAEFQDLLYQTQRSPGAANSSTTVAPAPLEVGLGVRPVATPAIHSQGSLQATENELDIAIEGHGFLAVRTANGSIGYTRAGSLRLDADGNLVTSDGDPLEPSISIPTSATFLQIGADGTVTAVPPGDATPQVVGQIELSLFANPSGLASLGRNLFEVSPASGDPTVVAPGEQGAGTLAQGFLEASNVQVVQEFVAMIQSQRGYEAIARVLRTADEMYSTVNSATR